MRAPFHLEKSETPVLSTPGLRQFVPKTAALPDGGWLAVWEANAASTVGGEGTILVKYSSDGEVLGYLTIPPEAGDYEDISVLPDGGWIITLKPYSVQETAHDVVHWRFSGDGIPQGDAEIVGTNTIGTQIESKVVVLEDGGWVVVWRSYHNDRVTSEGYHTVDEVFQQRYSSAGEKVGGEVQVNTFEPGSQYQLDLVALPDGGWLVTYIQNEFGGEPGGIYQQRYASDGQPVGENYHFVVQTPVLDNVPPPPSYLGPYLPKDPDVTVLEDGGWVLVWTMQGRDSWKTKGVFQQRFDADGQKVGEEQQVNSVIYGDQFSPSAEALPDGGWVVVWRTNQQIEGQEGAYTRQHDDIHAQRYDAEGKPVGGEITINEDLSDIQYNPQVELLADGNLVFSWQSDGQVFQSIWKPSLAGSDAADTLIGYETADRIYGEAGNDVLSGFGGDDMIFGDGGKDTLDGGDGSDRVFSGSGADLLRGGNGDDTLGGSGGFDTIYGGEGNDLAYGGNGADQMDGGAGNDQLIAGLGNDKIVGGAGDDEIDAGGGNDGVNAGLGDDTVSGGAGNDTLGGGDGQDRLWGGTGNDKIFAGEGNDTLRGGSGDDELWAGSGADILDGRAGNDTLRGGADADVLVFSSGEDQVIGFGPGDRIDLSGVSEITDFADLRANHLSGGADAMIDDGEGNTMILVGVAEGLLDAGDFIF